MKKDQTIVIGHKNPDTDSVCSAICYAELKRTMTGREYVPARAGSLNDETKYVLSYFGVEPPVLLESVKAQVQDVAFRELAGMEQGASMKEAWNRMRAENVTTLPVVRGNGMLEGLITVTEIAKSYMNLYDRSALSKAGTSYRNIVRTLDGTLAVAPPAGVERFARGKVLIAAEGPDSAASGIEAGDLVILGAGEEAQLEAVRADAACLAVCEGADVPPAVRALAAARGCAVIVTPHDAFTAARLIDQSIPVGYLMRREDLITFDLTDTIEEIREVMAIKRHRDFPILDEDGTYCGMISRRDILGATGKKLILVDHNEQTQAVSGVETADVLEIIDHHRLGGLQTISPVVFRNQPLGCTATIIYEIYQEAGLPVPKTSAGLLTAAILSDTLSFRSPTCTERDRAAALALAEIAGLDWESFAENMFAAGSNLKGKTEEEIFYQDHKSYTAGKKTFTVGQCTVPNQRQAAELAGRIMPYLAKVHAAGEADYSFFMVTDLMRETTTLLCAGAGAEQMVRSVFAQEAESDGDPMDGVVKLRGVVSRKKQLVPQILIAME